MTFFVASHTISIRLLGVQFSIFGVVDFQHTLAITHFEWLFFSGRYFSTAVVPELAIDLNGPERSG